MIDFSIIQDRDKTLRGLIPKRRIWGQIVRIILVLFMYAPDTSRTFASRAIYVHIADITLEFAVNPEKTLKDSSALSKALRPLDTAESAHNYHSLLSVLAPESSSLLEPTALRCGRSD